MGKDIEGKVLCSSCAHYWGFGPTIPMEPRCAATRVNYVSENAFSFALCRNVNKEGVCERWEPKKPTEQPDPGPWWWPWGGKSLRVGPTFQGD